MATGHRGVSKLFARALDDVRKSKGQSRKNEDRLRPMSQKEPEPWKLQQLREENRGEPLQECRSSQRMQRSAESWQQEIRELKELLGVRDQKICRLERERRTLSEDHADTLALLSSTQEALKKEGEKCASVQEQCCRKLVDQDLRHQAELRDQEERFQREVCENITKQMVSDLHLGDVMETETRRKLEEISEEKESSNSKEIRLLTERVVQLQQLLSNKEKKKNQKSKFSLMKFFFRR